MCLSGAPWGYLQELPAQPWMSTGLEAARGVLSREYHDTSESGLQILCCFQRLIFLFSQPWRIQADEISLGVLFSWISCFFMTSKSHLLTSYLRCPDAFKHKAREKLSFLSAWGSARSPGSLPKYSPTFGYLLWE